MSAKMILGGYTFNLNPHRMSNTLDPEVISNSELTWEGVHYFSWPATVVGKRVKLIWDLMTVEQYIALQALWVADLSIVYNPDNGSTYNVMIMGLKGVYFLNTDNTNALRKDCELELLILSVV
jgi:hypothetical protein